MLLKDLLVRLLLQENHVLLLNVDQAFTKVGFLVVRGHLEGEGFNFLVKLGPSACNDFVFWKRYAFCFHLYTLIYIISFKSGCLINIPGKQN